MSAHVHVFVLVDGLGWRVLEGRSFLGGLLPHRQPLRTVLGYSSAAIPTLLTGRSPAEHGHWNLVYYDPEGSPFQWLRHLAFLPEAALDNRIGRRLLKETGRRVLGLGPLFECAVRPRLLPWFNWVEKRSLYEQGGVPGVSTLFDQLAGAAVPYRSYSYHRASDAEILRQACLDIRESRARVFFLYLSELDAVLHAHCRDPDVVADRLAWYGEGLRAVFEAALARDSRARLSVFSDHGMTPVEQRHDLVTEVEALALRTPQDYLAVYDSTMARFWFFNERARRTVRDRLSELAWGRLLDDDELRELGVLFPDRRYGELILLLEPGSILAHSGFNGRRWQPEGMHGYHPRDPWSDGVFLSREPPPRPVAALGDVQPCLSAWLGTAGDGP